MSAIEHTHQPDACLDCALVELVGQWLVDGTPLAAAVAALASTIAAIVALSDSTDDRQTMVRLVAERLPRLVNVARGERPSDVAATNEVPRTTH